MHSLLRDCGLIQRWYKDMDNISKYFTLQEATSSAKATALGIDNTIPKLVIPTVFNTAKHMDDVRELLAHPIHVDSFYRCLELNRSLGSKDTSQHLKGEAVDFICPDFGTPFEICQAIIKSRKILFDQLILEHTWVHISFKSNPADEARHQVLSLLESGGYALGLTDKHGILLT